MSDQTPRVPELWWSPKHGVLESGPVRGYYRVGRSASAYLSELPADAVKLVPIPSEPLPDSETERPRRCPALTPESDLITAGRQCQQYEGHPHDHSWYGDNGHACSFWAVTS